MTDQKKSYRIEAVGRSLSVLEALAERPGQGITELAQTLGLTKSIIFRLLFTLEERGFVVRDGSSGSYSLGYRVGILGERVGRDGTLLHAAPPQMEALRDTTGETVNLIVREGTRSLVLATRQGYHSIRLFAQAGRYGPLHAGGGSLLMLAYSTEELIERVLTGRLETFTPQTRTDPDDLRELLGRIRANGYNIAQNDLDNGAFSIAAPIRNVKGDVVAGLSLAGPMVRFDETTRARYLAAVQEAAGRISDKLSLN